MLHVGIHSSPIAQPCALLGITDMTGSSRPPRLTSAWEPGGFQHCLLALSTHASCCWHVYVAAAKARAVLNVMSHLAGRHQPAPRLPEGGMGGMVM